MNLISYGFRSNSNGKYNNVKVHIYNSNSNSNRVHILCIKLLSWSTKIFYPREYFRVCPWNLKQIIDKSILSFLPEYCICLLWSLKCLKGRKLSLSMISTRSEDVVWIKSGKLWVDAYRERTKENQCVGAKNLLSSP